MAFTMVSLAITLFLCLLVSTEINSHFVAQNNFAVRLGTYDNTISEFSPITYEINLDLLHNESNFSGFFDRTTNIKNIDYYYKFEVWEGNLYFVFRSTIPIQNFSFFTLGNHDENDLLNFYIRETLFSLALLPPNETIIIQGPALGCALPASGFSFVGKTGNVRFFGVWTDNSCDPPDFAVREFTPNPPIVTPYAVTNG